MMGIRIMFRLLLVMLGMPVNDAKRCTNSIKFNLRRTLCLNMKTFPSSGMIPNDVQILDLVSCKFLRLYKDDMSRFAQLRQFSIAGSYLQTLEMNTFDDNKLLQRLSFRRNHKMDFTSINAALCNIASVNSIFSVLDLYWTHIGSQEWNRIRPCLDSMRLTRLDVHRNTLNDGNRFPDFMFSKMFTLQILLLDSGYSLNTMAFVNLTQLDRLQLSDGDLTSIPSFLHNDQPILPQLRQLYLSFNPIQTLPKNSTGLNQLELLVLQDVSIANMTGQELTTLSSNLKYLWLVGSKLFRMYPNSFKTDLKNLTIDNCGRQLYKGMDFALKPMIHLEDLSLKGIDLTHHHMLGVLFHQMTNLIRLNLRDALIRDLPDSTFKGLFKLVILKLSVNKIRVISATLFQDLVSLEKLYLDDNLITVLHRSSLTALSSLQMIALDSNQLKCDCGLLWLLELFRSHRIKFNRRNEPKAYVCQSPPVYKGMPLSLVNITEADCWHLSFASKLTIYLACGFTFVVVAVVLVYKFRWHIGYIYFLVRAKRREARECNDDQGYVYDAFVVYNRTDLSWVREKLLPLLEDEAHLRLCIHDRDWLLGRDIIDQIMQSIEASRKTILVVSNAFAISQWCNLEMTLAQHRLLDEDRNALILVLLEPITRENLTPRLVLQMRTQTYLAWTEDTVGQRLFWKKLMRAVRKPTSSIVHESHVQQRGQIDPAETGERQAEQPLPDIPQEAPGVIPEPEALLHSTAVDPSDE